MDCDDALGDELVPGFYLHRRRGHVSLPVAVWYGPPVNTEAEDLDDVTLDRSWRMQITLANKLLHDERETEAAATFNEVWPQCRALPITQEEHDYRIQRIEHAKQHAPHSPFAHKRGRIDELTAELPF